jgi:hypothetical protein
MQVEQSLRGAIWLDLVILNIAQCSQRALSRNPHENRVVNVGTISF